MTVSDLNLQYRWDLNLNYCSGRKAFKSTCTLQCINYWLYRRADNSLARPTSRCILFDGENISFDASLLVYINSTNIPPIMIINRIYLLFIYP